MIYKYKSVSLASAAGAWAEHIGDVLKQIVTIKYPETKQRETLFQEIDVLTEFEKKRLDGCLDSGADESLLVMKSPYDVLGWCESEENRSLTEYAVPEAISYAFEYTENQVGDRRDLFRRYGTSINALSKIMTRVGNVQSLYRTVKVVPGNSHAKGTANAD